jgi:hypothetical protein
LTRDTAYRWIRPLKAWEYYVDRGLGGVSYREGLNWLREHILAGRIRVEFDEIEITPTIAQIILECRELKWPVERTEHPLPSDFMLNRPDIERLLKRRVAPPTKRPGRPKSSGSLAVADYALVQRMNQMVSSFAIEAEYRRTYKKKIMPWPTFSSPSAAAAHLVQTGEVQGGGTNEAKVRRLVKRYQKIFGDDG